MHDSARIIEVLTSRLRQFVRDVGMRDVVIGVSGGIDSAVVLALAARALDNVCVHALFLPDTATPGQDRADALAVCEFAGVTMRETSIIPATLAMQQSCNWQLTDLARQNIAARTRMIVIYAYANSHSALVLGTGNRSELLVGYFTKYGDGGVDVLPIGSLYKTQVRAVAQELGLPESILAKSPSARLSVGQTDEEELGMTYKTLDKLLIALVDKRRPVSELKADFDPVKVERVRELIARSEHKRHIPPILAYE